MTSVAASRRGLGSHLGVEVAPPEQDAAERQLRVLLAEGLEHGVDRRIVRATVHTIESSPELLRVFSRLRPIGFLKDVASVMGWSAIEIIPTNAGAPGIIADVTGVIATSGISIRQALVTDPDLSSDPRLYVITESPVPAELIPRLKSCRGVKSIVIY